MDYIPKIAKQDLVHGEYYTGRCRNATVARWNAETQLFYHWRHKFGIKFVDEIKCPEDEPEYDVFVTHAVADAYETIPFPVDNQEK